MSERMNDQQQEKYLSALLLLLAVLFVYLPAVDGSFIFDDLQYIQGNPLLRDGIGLWKIWLDPKANPQYYPLTFTTFWFEFQLWQLWPTGYHLTNIFLHGLNTLLLWQILCRSAVPGAWVAAAIFAVHPVQVESVAWISERKNVLSGFFSFLTILLYMRFYSLDVLCPDPSRHRSLLYSLVIGSFVAALLSKTAVCILPGILLLLLWWKTDRLTYKDFLLLLPLFVFGLIFALGTAYLEQDPKVVGAAGHKWDLTFIERILIAGRGICFYFSTILFPINLSFIYPRWDIQSKIWWQYLFPSSVCIVIVGLLALYKKEYKSLVIVFSCFLVSLLPVVGFIDYYFMKFSFVADHFQYLSCISIIACIVGWFWKHSSKVISESTIPSLTSLGFQESFFRSLISAAVIIVLMILTRHRAAAYADSVTLWMDTIEKNPKGLVAYNNLGWELIQRHDYRKALSYLEKALELGPEEAKTHSNLSIALFETKEIERALQHAVAAVRYAPKLADYTNNLSMIYWHKGDLVQAIQYAHAALQKDPISSQVYYNVGALALHEVSMPEAFSFAEGISYIERAIQLDPDSITLMQLLAWLRATAPEQALRDGKRAVDLAERACHRTGYRDPNLLDTLAAAYAENGQFEVAIDTAQTAAQLARASGMVNLESRIRDRLAFYHVQTPYYNMTQEKFPF